MPIQSYLRQVHRLTKKQRHANWDLSRELKLGDIGKLNGGEFDPHSSLEKYNIPMEVRPGTRKVAKFDLKSERGINIKSLVQAEGGAQVVELTGEAAFEIGFERENTFVLQATGIQTDSLVNLEEIEQHLRELHEKKQWEEDYVIITEISRADSATLLLSASSGVKTTLSANGSFQVGEINIGNADIDFSIVSTKALAIEFVGEPGVTPLLKLKRLSNPWFGRPELESMGRNLESDGPNEEEEDLRLRDVTLSSEEEDTTETT